MIDMSLILTTDTVTKPPGKNSTNEFNIEFSIYFFLSCFIQANIILKQVFVIY